MKYIVAKVEENRYGIIHPYVNTAGLWFYTEAEAKKMADFMNRESAMAAREEAAWDRYDREHGDE